MMQLLLPRRTKRRVLPPPKPQKLKLLPRSTKPSYKDAKDKREGGPPSNRRILLILMSKMTKRSLKKMRKRHASLDLKKLLKEETAKTRLTS